MRSSLLISILFLLSFLIIQPVVSMQSESSSDGKGSDTKENKKSPQSPLKKNSDTIMEDEMNIKVDPEVKFLDLLRTIEKDEDLAAALSALNKNVSELFVNDNESYNGLKHTIAETYQTLASSLSDDKQYDLAAEAFILSLRVVFDSHDLLCYLKRINFNRYNAIPDLKNIDKIYKDGDFFNLAKELSVALQVKYK